MSLSELLQKAQANLESAQKELRKARKAKASEAELAEKQKAVTWLDGYISALEEAKNMMKKAL